MGYVCDSRYSIGHNNEICVWLILAPHLGHHVIEWCNGSLSFQWYKWSSWLQVTCLIVNLKTTFDYPADTPCRLFGKYLTFVFDCQMIVKRLLNDLGLVWGNVSTALVWQGILLWNVGHVCPTSLMYTCHLHIWGYQTTQKHIVTDTQNQIILNHPSVILCHRCPVLLLHIMVSIVSSQIKWLQAINRIQQVR